ncbi:type IV toxin-antitoxin system AbiEi family antitoxin domain-containing protein [Nesterenkonia sp. Act20]|uniref:type IV toxin-antitoxin system AbiEi family antitoxin domain-containing protein n=1 Tax=Nesterenkonia sp. Act20 TaxID=1483432 RepID=UPI001C445FAB|nr:type IV toxin-antitoxin system AbiEi family antitoxin domain-containing protein [Nesterenkonia sp. Act20]
MATHLTSLATALPRGRLFRAKDLWDSSGGARGIGMSASSDVEEIGRRLSALVDAGELLRIRRGVYLHPSTWLQSAPWDRHLIAAAAVHLLAPQTHFCRTTALTLHGLGLLHPPDAVTVRTAHNSETGLHPAPSLTGRASTTAIERLQRTHPPAHPQTHDGGAPSPAALRAIGTRHHQYPRTLRDRLREGLGEEWKPAYEQAILRQPFPVLQAFDAELTAGREVCVEPLGLVLADTVPRLNFADAVVVLDAYKAGRVGEGERPAGTLSAVEPWLRLVASARGRARWDAAWTFADARAESAGESWARVRIAELGFSAPVLQRMFLLPNGKSCITDFFWEGPGVVGEFDGLMKYRNSRVLSGRSAEEVVIAEKEREDGLRALGLSVLRFTWADLQDPSRLRRLLNAAGVPFSQRFTGADAFYQGDRRAGRTRKGR